MYWGAAHSRHMLLRGLPHHSPRSAFPPQTSLQNPIKDNLPQWKAQEHKILKGSNKEEPLSLNANNKTHNTQHRSPQYCARHVRQSHLPILAECAKEQPPKPPATFHTPQALNTKTHPHDTQVYTQTLPAATHARLPAATPLKATEAVSQQCLSSSPNAPNTNSTPARLAHSDARLWWCGAQKNTAITETETALGLPAATSPLQRPQRRPQVLLRPGCCSCSCCGACQHPCQLCCSC